MEVSIREGEAMNPEWFINQMQYSTDHDDDGAVYDDFDAPQEEHYEDEADVAGTIITTETDIEKHNGVTLIPTYDDDESSCGAASSNPSSNAMIETSFEDDSDSDSDSHTTEGVSHADEEYAGHEQDAGTKDDYTTNDDSSDDDDQYTYNTRVTTITNDDDDETCTDDDCTQHDDGDESTVRKDAYTFTTNENDDDDNYTYNAYDSTINDNDNDNDSPAKRSERARQRFTGNATAAATGAVAGWLFLGGPVGAVAVGASSAYLISQARHNPNIRNLVRNSGDSVNNVNSKVKEKLDRAKISVRKSKIRLQKAKKSCEYKKQELLERMEAIEEKRKKIHNRLFCCGSCTGSGGNPADYVVVNEKKLLDVDDEAFQLRTFDSYDNTYLRHNS